jgi:ribosomal protein L35
MHSNEANITFPCAFDTCKRAFRTYSAFKSHVFRDHVNDSNKRKLSGGEASGILHCPLGFCGRHIESLQDLIKHLNDHIMQGNEIICPFQGCGMKYSVKSSFSSHLSRHHKETTNRQLLPDLVIGDQSSSTCNEPETPDITLDSNANYLNFDDCNSDISDDSDR